MTETTGQPPSSSAATPVPSDIEDAPARPAVHPLARIVDGVRSQFDSLVGQCPRAAQLTARALHERGRLAVIVHGFITLPGQNPVEHSWVVTPAHDKSGAETLIVDPSAVQFEAGYAPENPHQLRRLEHNFTAGIYLSSTPEAEWYHPEPADLTWPLPNPMVGPGRYTLPDSGSV